jgi:hypothetical protein
VSKSPQIYPLSLKVAGDGAAGHEVAGGNDQIAHSGGDVHAGDDASKADRVGAGAAAGREQLEGGVCGVAGGQYVFDEAGVAGGIGVVNQLDGAGAGDQAANKRAEGVAVVGDIKGVFGNVQRPAPGANDGCVGSCQRRRTEQNLLRREEWPCWV